MLLLFNVHDMSTKKINKDNTPHYWAPNNKRLNGEKTNIEIISHHTKGQNKQTTNEKNTSHHKPPQQSRSSWHHTPSSWHLNVLDIYKAHTAFHLVNIKMHTKLIHKELHLSLQPPRVSIESFHIVKNWTKPKKLSDCDYEKTDKISQCEY